MSADPAAIVRAMRSLLALACVAALGTACAAGASPHQADRAAFTPRPRRERVRRNPSSSRARRARPAGSTSSSRAAGSSCSQNGKRRSTPLLDIRGLVTAGGEQGLLGLAFHPSYPKVRKLYVQYTARDGSTKVVEYRTNGHTRERAPAALLQPSIRTATTTAACSPSARTAGSTSRWATAAPAGDPGEPRSEHALALREAALHERRHEGARRSRRSGSATRGASRSTGRTATSTSATSARATSRRSTTCRRPAPASRTTAGTSTRAARSSRTSRSARASS